MEKSSADAPDHQKDDHEWVLQQINPETLLGAKMSKLKLSYLSFSFDIHEKADFLEKTTMLAKIESGRKRGRPNKRWFDLIKEASAL